MANKKVDAYTHKDEKRLNNPQVGLVSSQTDKLDGRTKYEHDPHIDPQLSWAGKKEGTSFEVPNVSLHIHERIDPKRIVKAFLKSESSTPKQISLFEEPDNEPPLNKAIDFYSHDQDWTNRLIAGDSLLVMNSLLTKEGMAGKVQMVYIDPPYGIKYNSNFQPFLDKKDVKDRDEDIPAEPEMIQAFRDTWELGIHSYLTHLRDRLLLSKELLHESGSVFVQISDENVHHARELMDEVFGSENFVSLITFRKANISLGSNLLSTTCDYICWYAKNKNELTKQKYHQLFLDKNISKDDLGNYQYVEVDGNIRRISASDNFEEIISKGKIFTPLDMLSSGYTESCTFDYEFNGKIYKPKFGKSWKTTKQGFNSLVEKDRIFASSDRLYYKLYLDDYPISQLLNVWEDTRSVMQKIYAVQTDTEPIKRCILMVTDPGDLVFDPTCGSGTTAYVAEQWGRRWITCDTSRVAVTLAKQRLMTAKFDYYELAHKDEGVRSGFKYKTAPHITLGSLAQNEPAKEETLYDQPVVEKNKVRVTGPFTAEAVPSLRTKPFDGQEPHILANGKQLARTGETNNQIQWIDELKTTGIRATSNKLITFSIVEPMVGTRYLHAKGEIMTGAASSQPSGMHGGTDVYPVYEKAYISFGPDYGPLEQRQVEEAVKEARELKDKPNFVIFAAFHFDPEAAKDIDHINWPGVTILKAQMSVDLLTSDLRKKRSSNQSYWLIGQPDVDVVKSGDGTYKVKVNGFDYYNPVTGEIDSGSTNRIAMWFLDTDYDERSLFPAQVFFPASDSKRDWTKLAKALNGEVNQDLLETFVGAESLPFQAGTNRKIAVKIIDDRGIESFVVKAL